jgi:hypothetical protein
VWPGTAGLGRDAHPGRCWTRDAAHHGEHRQTAGYTRCVRRSRGCIRLSCSFCSRETSDGQDLIGSSRQLSEVRGPAESTSEAPACQRNSSCGITHAMSGIQDLTGTEANAALTSALIRLYLTPGSETSAGIQVSARSLIEGWRLRSTPIKCSFVTCVYRWVVAMEACPRNSWTIRMSTPLRRSNVATV